MKNILIFKTIFLLLFAICTIFVMCCIDSLMDYDMGWVSFVILIILHTIARKWITEDDLDKIFSMRIFDKK